MILETCLLERWHCMSQFQVLRTFQTLTTIKCTTDKRETEKKKAVFPEKQRQRNMEKLKSMFHVTHKFVNCQADFGVRGVLLVEVGAETPDQKQCPVGMITMLQNQQDTHQ